MTKEKKEHVQSCERHTYIVTGSMTKGGHEKATHVRCAHCLRPVDLESLESKEWVDANVKS